ncbi:MAG TPA: ABC transporter ATP-binding protein [Burkholderiaceae bacterium]|nr:ABC transporter ATP-binding protein [Burkholderiaceae bacterium]
MIEAHDLRRSFGGVAAIDGVSLAVARHEIVAIIGPNGAGKSTLFNLLTGHLKPDAGRVSLAGRDVTGLAPHKLCALGVARSFQRTNIFPKLSVFQNVQAALIAHRGRGRDLWSRAEQVFRDEAMLLLADVNLADKAELPGGALSYGNQKQLELGIALAGKPEILLLDEPTAGMSATETRDSMALLRRIASERGLTLLFTEHDMEVVFGAAQRIAVLHQGRLIAQGAPEAIRADAEVRRVYLGDRA